MQWFTINTIFIFLFKKAHSGETLENIFDHFLKISMEVEYSGKNLKTSKDHKLWKLNRRAKKQHFATDFYNLRTLAIRLVALNKLTILLVKNVHFLRFLKTYVVTGKHMKEDPRWVPIHISYQLG